MFEGKVAIVTGGASGIGRSTALGYARAGASVSVADVDSAGAEQTVSMIESAGGRAIFVKTDVSDPSNCESLVKSTVGEFGRLDFACNNAGIAGEQNPIDGFAVGQRNRERRTDGLPTIGIFAVDGQLSAVGVFDIERHV